MSQSKIYVGNLSYETNEDGLRQAFETYGNITELKLITDRDTGRSKGFAFITFESSDEAKAALDFDGNELDGRRLKVNEAKENKGGGRRDGGGRQQRFGGGGQRRQYD